MSAFEKLGRGSPALLGLAFLALASVPACDRAPRLVPAASDSARAVPRDSASLYVQMARDDWESADRTDDAARITARLLFDDLRAHPSAVPGDRARDFLDSLGMGAEVAGRDPAVVNLFARSDPSGGSWPHLFWRDQGTLRIQSLESGGLHLVGLAVEPAPVGAAANPQRIAVLFSRGGPRGQQPFAFVWQRPPGGPAWRLTQSLGTDSLGQVGDARVLEEGPGGGVLETRTYTVAPGFDECAACPHVFRTRRLRWGAPGLVVDRDETTRGSYATFIQFIQALAAGDRESAEKCVADHSVVSQAMEAGWGAAKGRWRLAPETAANAADLLLFRGAQEAWRVHFAAHGDDWRITGFEPASRSVE